jgi:hypothetical protein
VTTFLHDHNVVTLGRTKFWAERGLIHTEDTRTGAYKSVSVRAILRRMAGVSDMLGNSRQDMKQAGAMEGAVFDEHQRFLERMCDVVRQAQAQGMPSDPTACRDLVTRRPKTVVNPGYGGGL